MIIKKNKLKSIIINLSVFGSILSVSTTALRFTDDIGVGECLMILSILLFLFSYRQVVVTGASRILPSSLIYSFILLNFLGICFTVFFLSDIANDAYFSGVIRTALAYGFAIINAIIILLLIADKEDMYFILKRLIQCFNIINICTFIVLFSALLAAISSSSRFSGFAKNPNELGTAATIMPFVAFYLYKEKKIKLISLIITLITVVILAKAISSDALFYAFLASAFLFTFFVTKKYHISLRILLFLVFFLILYVFLIKNVETYIVKTNNDGNQASVRYTLWKNALLATEHSPLVGFGPGFFSGIDRPFEGSEAHNTFIDYLTNTGLIGLSIYLLFLGKIVLRLYAIKEYSLIVAFFALIIFSLFHNILRHPVFWLFLFLMHGYIFINQRAKKC